jgi:hypothetical protein
LDLGHSGEAQSGNSSMETAQSGPTRHVRHEELFGARAIKELLEKLAGNGFSIEHHARQDKPLFEVIEGSAKPHVRPLFSIPEIPSAIKEVGRRPAH